MDGTSRPTHTGEAGLLGEALEAREQNSEVRSQEPEYKAETRNQELE
jgi:hypothetical protein